MVLGLVILSYIAFLLVVISGIVLLHLVVHILMGIGLLSSPGVALGIWRIVVVVLVVIRAKIYMSQAILLVVGCCREGAFEE